MATEGFEAVTSTAPSLRIAACSSSGEKFREREAHVSSVQQLLAASLARDVGGNVRAQIESFERGGSFKEERWKEGRDLTGIRREDVERKRAEIGKERRRFKDENERRKEALTLLRFKLDAHVKRTQLRKMRDGKESCVPGQEQEPGALVSNVEEAAADLVGSNGEDAVKDIFVVECVSEDKSEQEKLQISKLLGAPQEPVRSALGVESREESAGRSASHLKLAEKVARLMEDFDAPALPRVKVTVVEDGDAGPVVMMKCSSRDHARVICETLSSKLGQQEDMVGELPEVNKSRRRINLLASFLKKLVSSKPRSKNQSAAEDVDSDMSSVFDSQTFDGTGLNRELREYIAATWRQKDDVPDAAKPHLSEGAPDGGAADVARLVRSANASPTVSNPKLVDASPAHRPASERVAGKASLFAGLFNTPSRKLSRAKSGRGMNRRADESGLDRMKARFFGFMSPRKGKSSTRFEDRLGPDAKTSGDVKFARTRSTWSFTMPARRNTRSGSGTQSPIAEKERLSGLLSSPASDRVRGLGMGGAPEQRWGFLGGLGSPVRDNRRCGSGWGPALFLTDVAMESVENDGDSTDEPTSPEVTCIGRVRVKPNRLSDQSKTVASSRELAATGKRLHHSWTASDVVERRKEGTLPAPHSGPVLRESYPTPTTEPAPAKLSRWRSLVGLYRSSAASSTTSITEGNERCSLSRCRNTSFNRFAGQRATLDGVVEDGTESGGIDDCEGGCEDDPPCTSPSCTSQQNMETEDSSSAPTSAKTDVSDVVEAITGKQDQGAAAPLVQQSLLWQRRQFTKPGTLDLRQTC